MTGNKVKSMLVVGALVLGSFVAAAPAQASSAPSVAATGARPGQFCAKADRGDVVRTSYGRLKCKADPKNSRYSRWYRI